MKKLSELIKDAEQIKESGVSTDGKAPLFDIFCDFPDIFDRFIEPFKTGKGKKREIPKELFGLLLEAYAFGAASALRTVKYGVLLRDDEGNIKDRAYYSIDELLSEAQALSCPDCEKANLEQELEYLTSDDDEDEEENDDEELELETVDELTATPKHLH